MSTSPYRIPSATPRSALDLVEEANDTELIPIFAIFWASSLGRVVLGLLRGEAFGTELTLAAVALFLLPLLAKDGLRSLMRRPRDADSDEDPSQEPRARG